MSLLREAAALIVATVHEATANATFPTAWNIADFGDNPPQSYVVFSFETPEVDFGMSRSLMPSRIVDVTLMSIADNADEAADLDAVILRRLLDDKRAIFDHGAKTGADSETAFHVVERTVTIDATYQLDTGN